MADLEKMFGYRLPAYSKKTKGITGKDIIKEILKSSASSAVQVGEAGVRGVTGYTDAHQNPTMTVPGLGELNRLRLDRPVEATSKVVMTALDLLPILGATKTLKGLGVGAKVAKDLKKASDVADAAKTVIKEAEVSKDIVKGIGSGKQILALPEGRNPVAPIVTRPPVGGTQKLLPSPSSIQLPSAEANAVAKGQKVLSELDAAQEARNSKNIMEAVIKEKTPSTIPAAMEKAKAPVLEIPIKRVPKAQRPVSQPKEGLDLSSKYRGLAQRLSDRYSQRPGTSEGELKMWVLQLKQKMSQELSPEAYQTTLEFLNEPMNFPHLGFMDKP